MYLGYDVKNGIKYAKICKSDRVNGKVVTTQHSLGRVLDEEKGIYKNRERGVFTYSIETGEYGKPPADFIIPKSGKRKAEAEKLILDFGDSFFLSRYISAIGLEPAIDAIGYGNMDSVHALVHYYVLSSLANDHCEDWAGGNYVSQLYPKANLVGQRISEMLGELGNEAVHRRFFRSYLPMVGASCDDEVPVLIDSTGLPNSNHLPMTAISSHNGKISNEARLIYVVQQESELPIFFRHCDGNIIDITSIRTTMTELKAYNVNVKFAILDAGCLDDCSIEILYENGISFVSRMKENRTLYKRLAAEHIPTISENVSNLVSYNGRYAYIKSVKCELVPGRTGYVYVGLDLAMKNMESGKLFDKAVARNMSEKEVHGRLQNQGVFMLYSSRPIARDKILPLYYTRQQIEQVFDIEKNYAKLVPLRVQNVETFRGHLLVTFIAGVILKKMQQDLKDSGYNPISAFNNLRNHKCKVFESCIIPQEAAKKANDIYKLFKINVPSIIQLA